MTEKKPLKRKIKVALKRKSKIFKRSITCLLYTSDAADES